jgi:hypothetical protein
MGKIPVSVIALYIPEDAEIRQIPISQSLAAKYRVVPLRICTNDGERIYIDRITDISRQASLKAGGLGNRYTCLATFGIIQKELFLYKDEDEWYLEEKF